MRIQVLKQTHLYGDRPCLYMEPESLADHALLETLVSEYEIQGMGRMPSTWELLHVELDLRGKQCKREQKNVETKTAAPIPWWCWWRRTSKTRRR